MRSTDGTKQEYREGIHENAEEAFKKHEIKTLAFTEKVKAFYCGNPKSSHYCFYIVFSPFCVTQYGDIGDIIVMPHDYDSFKWLQVAKNDWHYIRGKTRNIEKNVFFPDEAKKRVKEDESLTSEEREELLEMIGWDTPFHEFYSRYYDITGDCESSDGLIDYDSSVYWGIEALCWFYKNYKWDENAQAEK